MAKPGRIWLAGLALVLISAGAREALALSLEQAREDCRASVGRPFVQQCMHGGGATAKSAAPRPFPSSAPAC